MGWHELAGPAFSLRRTLLSGQVFRWREVPQRRAGSGDSFIGVLGREVVQLKQDAANSPVRYRVVMADGAAQGDAAAAAAATRAQLHAYFNLDVDVAALHRAWLASTSTTELHRQWRGVVEAAGEEQCVYLRVLQQPPHECLFTFLCTQNNNVARITQMIEKFCAAYGDALGEAEGTVYHAFPSLERLGEAVFTGDLEGDLRKLGFGYRAKFIEATVAKLLEDRTDLNALRGADYKEVLNVLTSLPGVGRKVADCVALFSLDQHQVTPIDVHVLRIAKHCLAGEVEFKKTLTPTAYNAVQAAFEKDFGGYAGWAHSMLFHAEMAGAEQSTKKQIKQRQQQEDVAAAADGKPRRAADKEKHKKQKQQPKQPVAGGNAAAASKGKSSRSRRAAPAHAADTGGSTGGGDELDDATSMGSSDGSSLTDVSSAASVSSDAAARSAPRSSASSAAASPTSVSGEGESPRAAPAGGKRAAVSKKPRQSAETKVTPKRKRRGSISDDDDADDVSAAAEVDSGPARKRAARPQRGAGAGAGAAVSAEHA